MPSFDRDAYRHAVRQLAAEVHEGMGSGMSMRSALYRSLGGCVFDFWNRDVSLRICEVSEREPEIDVVNDVVAEDTSDTHADYEVYIRAMALSVLAQDVRVVVENTVNVESSPSELRANSRELPE
ncbi:hypothetical protein [Haladaptatus sp. DFWS20]|uniref:hypothetical protein n=1 Tax=Haladaptatus sp. DFWS20 TaxID=3403467 RepID=UPI003EBDC8A5